MPKQGPRKSLDELKQAWRHLAQAAEKTIMGKYHARRAEIGGFGHEGLGVYGIYQERLACKKVQLAVKLLQQAGLEVTTGNIQKMTGQSRNTIEYYRPTPIRKPLHG